MRPNLYERFRCYMRNVGVEEVITTSLAVRSVAFIIARDWPRAICDLSFASVRCRVFERQTAHSSCALCFVVSRPSHVGMTVEQRPYNRG